MGKLANVAVLDMVNGEITKVAYDGAEYTKVNVGDAIAGDLVLSESESSFFTEGAFYLAQEVYEDGTPRMKDDDNDWYSMNDGTYALFRKVSSDSPTLEQRVTALESEVSTLKGEAKPATSETVDVFELVAKGQAPYEPKVGDIVVVTANTNHSANKIGDVGVVGESRFVGRFTVNVPGRENTGDGWTVTKKGEVRPATAEEVAAYEKAQAPKFAVGDYAKVVKSELGNEGKIVQITDDSEGLQMRKANDDIVPADYLGVPVGDTDVYGFAADQLVKATAEEAKWAKLDRKVGEFRKGDIVRAEKSNIPASDINGHYGKVEDIGGNMVGIRYANGRYCGAYTADGNVELITPVEATQN